MAFMPASCMILKVWSKEMNTRLAVVGLLVAAGLASPSLADPAVRLVRFRTDDISSVCVNRYTTAAEMQAGVQYYIGNNPIGIAYDGQSMYISGIANGSVATSGGGSTLPMARLPDGTPTDFGGGVINPLTGRVIIGGEALSEIIQTGVNYPAGAFWSHGMTKITINPNGTRTFVANKYMKSGFRDSTFITAANPDGVVTMGLQGSRATGVDFAPGVGLLLSFDSGGGVNAAGKVRWYDTATQINPILKSPSPTFQLSSPSQRVIASPSWDFGPDGTGFDYKDVAGNFNPDGTKDGPLVALLLNPGSPNVNQWGPIGVDKERLNFNYTGSDPVAGAVGFPGVIYHSGIPSGPSQLPALNGGPVITDPSRVFFRDISIHPQTGTIVARASNDLIYAYRNADGTSDPLRRGRILSTIDGAFTVGQKASIIWGIPGATDLAVWNDMFSQGNATDPLAQLFPFATLVRFSKLDGATPPADATVEVVDEITDPITGLVSQVPLNLTINGAIIDMHYHQPSKTLAMVEFIGRRAFLFRVEAITTTPTCVADVNGDNVVDGSDFVAFVNSFGVGDVSVDPIADVNRDLIIDGNDFVEFINAFGAGC